MGPRCKRTNISDMQCAAVLTHVNVESPAQPFQPDPLATRVGGVGGGREVPEERDALLLAAVGNATCCRNGVILSL